MITVFDGSVSSDGKVTVTAAGADTSVGCSTITFNWSGNFDVATSEQASSGVLTGENLDSFVRQFDAAVGDRLTFIQRRNQRALVTETAFDITPGGAGFQSYGLAAGDLEELPWGIWGRVAVTISDEDFSSTAFESQRASFPWWS